jgi:membrane-associated HD superfamily phosphohydrolase
MKKKTSLVLLSLSLIIASLVLLMSMMTNYRTIPFAYAKTNAAMLTTLEVNNSNDDGKFINNAAASSTIANTITSDASNTTTEGLQIKTNVNYFDSSSGYLVYPFLTTGKKLPTVIMIHEW